MLFYFLKRILLIIPTFLAITILCFGLTQFVPGGPIEQHMMAMRGLDGGAGATPTTTSVGTTANEPISDTSRSILDGHIVLSRALAHKNHYQAIDVLQSLSRVMNDIVSDEQKAAAGVVRNLMAVHAKNEDLINIGAYVSGSDPLCDKAIALIDNINEFLKQSTKDKIDFTKSVNDLLQLGQLAGMQ